MAFCTHLHFYLKSIEKEAQIKEKQIVILTIKSEYDINVDFDI